MSDQSQERISLKLEARRCEFAQSTDIGPAKDFELQVGSKTKGALRIGRNPKGEVVVNRLSGVSWNHLEILTVPGSNGSSKLAIKDVSSNGTALLKDGKLHKVPKNEEIALKGDEIIVLPLMVKDEKQHGPAEAQRAAFCIETMQLKDADPVLASKSSKLSSLSEGRREEVEKRNKKEKRSGKRTEDDNRKGKSSLISSKLKEKGKDKSRNRDKSRTKHRGRNRDKDRYSHREKRKDESRSKVSDEKSRKRGRPISKHRGREKEVSKEKNGTKRKKDRNDGSPDVSSHDRDDSNKIQTATTRSSERSTTSLERVARGRDMPLRSRDRRNQEKEKSSEDKSPNSKTDDGRRSGLLDAVELQFEEQTRLKAEADAFRKEEAAARIAAEEESKARKMQEQEAIKQILEAEETARHEREIKMLEDAEAHEAERRRLEEVEKTEARESELELKQPEKPVLCEDSEKLDSLDIAMAPAADETYNVVADAGNVHSLDSDSDDELDCKHKVGTIDSASKPAISENQHSNFDALRQISFDANQEVWKEQKDARDKKTSVSCLPTWAIVGGKALWWSESQKKHFAVRISKIDQAKRYVFATFENDAKVWKSVPFSLMSRKDCPLRPPPRLEGRPDGGTDKVKVAAVSNAPAVENRERSRSRSRRSRSATPDAFEAEKRRLIQTVVEEREAERLAAQRRRALAEEEQKTKEEERKRLVREAEQRKIEEAFERRKKEAEAQQLREEEEWRQRLREQREKEAAEEEERQKEKEERRKKRREEKEKEKAALAAKEAREQQLLQEQQLAAQQRAAAAGAEAWMTGQGPGMGGGRPQQWAAAGIPTGIGPGAVRGMLPGLPQQAGLMNAGRGLVAGNFPQASLGAQRMVTAVQPQAPAQVQQVGGNGWPYGQQMGGTQQMSVPPPPMMPGVHQAGAAQAQALAAQLGAAAAAGWPGAAGANAWGWQG